VPRNGEPSDSPFSLSFASSPTSVFASPSHIPSPPSSSVTKVATPQSSSLDTPSAFPGDIDFGALNPVDASMNLLDDSDAIMSYDFGYGQFVPSKTPYKTIASNPMFMSFADPSVQETALTSKSSAQSPGSNGGNPYELTFGWTGQQSTHEGNSQAASLDELFAGNIFGPQSPMSLNALIKSSVTSPVNSATSALSPITLQSVPSPSNGPSSNSSPSFESSDGSSPPAGSGSHRDCPKTRAQMEQHIQASGSSIFAPPPPQEKEPQNLTFKAPAGADGPVVICQGATFPRTEKSDKNIEVLAAWESITSHPHFIASVSNPPHTSSLVLSSLIMFMLKDMNELCSAFADKARCDGTKVVLDPQGVTSILEKFSTRLNSSP
jgi:AP-1-like transcription factor